MNTNFRIMPYLDFGKGVGGTTTIVVDIQCFVCNFSICIQFDEDFLQQNVAFDFTRFIT